MMNVAVIGADSSHTLEYVRRMVDNSVPESQRVHSLNPISCMTMVTPFQNSAGISARCELLKQFSVATTTDFDEAIRNADAVMLELNDAADHLPFIEKCSELKLPVFLDKPLADSYKNGVTIANIVRSHNFPFFSSSPLRFAFEVREMQKKHPNPQNVTVFGALGAAAAGSSIIWYGVHAFEILVALIGCGAVTLLAEKNLNNVICVVNYSDGRNATVILQMQKYSYGGKVDNEEFQVHAPNAEFYGETLKAVEQFFHTKQSPVPLEDTLEVMALLDAVERSLAINDSVQVY